MKEKIAALALEIYNSIRLPDRAMLCKSTVSATLDEKTEVETYFHAASLWAEAFDTGTGVSYPAIFAAAKIIETKFNL